MFTIEQINDARYNDKGKLKFPEYVQEIIKLGVTSYETYVEDGHSIYFGKDGFKSVSDEVYESLSVSDQSDTSQFVHDLRVHQEGGRDYLTFCSDCAKSGVEKWVVDMSKMTCTYYDKAGQVMLIERIPTLQEDNQLQESMGMYS